MGAVRWLELDSNDNISIVAATVVGSYTCNADRAVYATLYAQGLAGNGDYVYHVTVTPSGLSEAEALKTTQTLGATTYVLWGQTIPVTLRNGDVMKVYLKGLAGDGATPDTRVNFFEDASLQPTTADRTLDVSTTGEAGLDFDNIKAATAPTTLTNITVPTVTSATLAATQNAITWAQQKIVANVANEGALDIRNANAAGHGTLNDGGNVGLYNSGASVGQYNFGTANYGVQNTGASGQVNVGTAGDGIYASGTDHGVEVIGAVSALSDNILAEFFSVDSGETSATAIDGSVVKEIADSIAATVFPAGAISYTYTLTNSTTLLPVEGAEVWFSTDNPAVNIVWKGDTDVFGVARDVLGNLPQLDAGVYFIWAQLAGYSANAWPDIETVS